MAANGALGSPSKSELRGQIRASRARRSSDERAWAGQAIAAAVMPIVDERRSRCVACYFSLATEPSTAPLLDELWAAGIVVLTPRVRGTELEWIRSLPESPYTSGAFGIREVQGGHAEALVEADLVFMPALAVSTSGVRLGQGGGFYDRALSRLEQIPLLIALLYAEEDSIDVPGQAHDVPVDVVATERGIRWITKGAWSPST